MSESVSSMKQGILQVQVSVEQESSLYVIFSEKNMISNTTSKMHVTVRNTFKFELVLYYDIW